MRGLPALVSVGRFLVALFWLVVLLGGLIVLSGRPDSSVSSGLFLAAVGLLGVLLVVRAGATANRSTLDRVPPLITTARPPRLRSVPPGVRVSQVTWARRTEQSRRRLGRELTLLAERRGGPSAADRPALARLRDGSGPADGPLIAAAIDEAVRR